MQYTKCYGCPVLFLQDVYFAAWFNISQIYDSMRKTQT